MYPELKKEKIGGRAHLNSFIKILVGALVIAFIFVVGVLFLYSKLIE